MLAIRALCHNPRPRPGPLVAAFRWLTGAGRRRKVVFGPPVERLSFDPEALDGWVERERVG